MTDRTTHRRLLAELLEMQEEPVPAAPAFTEARIRAAVTGAQPLSREEKRTLWTSPDARHHYLAVRRIVLAELRESMRGEGLGRAETRRAASGMGDGRIEGAGFAVVVLAPDGEGAPWSILVELGERYAERLPTGLTVTLRDDGGLVWASGVPDETRRFGGEWTQSETPWARHAAFGLSLDP